RSYQGAYTMGLGSPRAIYERVVSLDDACYRYSKTELVELRRRRAVFRVTPLAGLDIPRWSCIQRRVNLERYPTNSGLPRASVTEQACAAKGDAGCVWEVRWKSRSLGPWFWAPTLTGAAIAAFLWLALSVGQHLVVAEATALAALPALVGMTAGFALLERRRR